MLGKMYPWGVGCLPASGPFCCAGTGPGSGGLLSAFTVSGFASGWEVLGVAWAWVRGCGLLGCLGGSLDWAKEGGNPVICWYAWPC